MKKAVTLLLICTLLSCPLLQGCDFDTSILENHKKELSAEEIYELVSPSVVEITGETPTGISTGTGFFYDTKGTVVTNYHVIEKCTTAKITTANNKNYAVKEVMGYSIEKDIAILSTYCSNSMPLSIRSSTVKTGETVYAIGSSLGLTGSLSNGIVSSAQRDIDGETFIQTTTPISPGNSGGPLIDKDGKVVGITTASFIDGQNLNLAIPIAKVYNISTYNPTTLDSLFQPRVEWISERQIWHQDDYNRYVLVFQISNEEKIPMSCSGTAEICIVNDNGITVYNEIINFTKNDFQTWYYDNYTIEKFQATIFINDADIIEGNASDGTIYFTVYGDGYYFEESNLAIYDLPFKPINITPPSFPFTNH